MACPNCDHTMEGISNGYFWCPRCGSLKAPKADPYHNGADFVDTPKLIERCREFEKSTSDWFWRELGIAEAIHVPACRDVTGE